MSLVLAAQISMVGRIDRCLLLSYRVPAAAVESLVPRGLDLVTLEARGERWAFWNIVVCHIEAMRPAFMPASLGVTYHHAAYRLRVRASTSEGELSGVYFVRSDCDDGLITLAGDFLSDFRFHKAEIFSRASTDRFVAEVRGEDAEAGLSVEADLAGSATLAPGSVFPSLENARDFLKYEPMGLAVADESVRLAEVQRTESQWRERAVRVTKMHSEFLRARSPGAELELATWVEPIDYRWTLGRRARLSKIPDA